MTAKPDAAIDEVGVACEDDAFLQAQLEVVPRVFPLELPATPRAEVARRG